MLGMLRGDKRSPTAVASSAQPPEIRFGASSSAQPPRLRLPVLRAQQYDPSIPPAMRPQRIFSVSAVKYVLPYFASMAAPQTRCRRRRSQGAALVLFHGHPRCISGQLLVLTRPWPWPSQIHVWGRRRYRSHTHCIVQSLL